MAKADDKVAVSPPTTESHGKGGRRGARKDKKEDKKKDKKKDKKAGKKKEENEKRNREKRSKDGRERPDDGQCDGDSRGGNTHEASVEKMEEEEEEMTTRTKERRKKKAKNRNGGKKRKSRTPDADEDDSDGAARKERRKKKKRRRRREGVGGSESHDDDEDEDDSRGDRRTRAEIRHFSFEYRHILAPMVGASELAFRLLCRKYGATLSYTPMMNASQFIREAAERAATLRSRVNDHRGGGGDEVKNYNYVANSDICEFQTIPPDRPLVVHFAANDPSDFANAARLVEPHCDAIDLNLGCPQRTAYVGHFGSYLLGEDDRRLILDIVRAGRDAVSVPIFVKIRLLDKVEDTIELCRQLRDAGASLVAIHARYRASWERTSSGARDGPALLDQVSAVKKSMGPDFPIISNGNVITYDDVLSNMKFTGADGIMSAEGILDNPALYLPRLGDAVADGDREILIPTLSPLRSDDRRGPAGDEESERALRRLRKKLREVEAIEDKVRELGENGINDDQRRKLRAKTKIRTELKDLEKRSGRPCVGDRPDDTSRPRPQDTKSVKLSKLFEAASDKLVLAQEYLSLVRTYPMKIRSVIFHVRRMCRDALEQYQLIEECIACATVDEVEAVVRKCDQYARNPDTFRFDRLRADRDREALEAKRREEGKRRAYEGRMTRKAKREGLADLEHYLRIGAEVPTVEMVARLKRAPREERLAAWRKDHSQHCMEYHLEDEGCKRDRACAFLHVAAKDVLVFDEDDEVAG